VRPVNDRLSQYRRKRDFTKTPEPTGGGHKAGAGLRFVVQKHAARRLHYDFRLEMDGVLKSWAVPKGPSLDPRAKRLAVHVEDHPLDYGDFEGVIPEGEYGGGTVIVWDSGTWVPEGDPEEGYGNGVLKFELRGRRLKGRWALVQMKGREGGKNWLLLKEKDEVARLGSDDEIVAENQTSAVTGRDIKQVADAQDRVWHSKESRGGGRSNTGDGADPPPVPRPDPSKIPGVRKAAMPQEPGPQLAKVASAVPRGDGWLHEIKLDGYRLLARNRRGKVKLLTRRGNDWTDRFPMLAEAVAALPVEEAILDGEAVHLLPNGVSSFGALQDDLAREDTSGVFYYVFDLLHLDGYDLTAARLDQRKEALRTLLAGVPAGIVRYSDHVKGRGDAFEARASRMGIEGVVSKRADSPYRAARSGAWLKIKFDRHDELAVIGWTDPEGTRQALGSLLLGYFDPEGKPHFAGGVGTGFSDETLRDLRGRLAPLERKGPPSREVAKLAPRRAHWVEPELVAEVRYANWTGDGRLRAAAFIALREDKKGRDIVLDPATHAPPGAVAPTETPPSVPPDPPPVEVSPKTTLEFEGVRLTHAGKVLYPESNITKLDLARYYALVCERMLPEAGGRPLTLLRAPEGWRGHHFYQKHGNATVPKAVKRVRLAEREGGAEGIYLFIDDKPGLLSLVQMGVLEIHLWGARASDVAHPDRVVMDLDPDEGLPWSRVVEAALTLRRMLEELGLESFVKGTGGKGLHVVAPLRPRHDWAEVKAFAKWLAEELVAREPSGYTAVMAKKKRHGKIFIDYLRNQRGASAIGAYSARARHNAPVAAPLTWREVEEGVRSDAFTVRTMPERLASLAKDPWEDLGRVKQSLSAAVLRKLPAA
jgi:bifunctional non-homologous end joining protein LigD